MNCQNRVKEDLRSVPFWNGDAFMLGRERPHVKALERDASAPEEATEPMRI
jgi:hypothetical protein